MYAVVKSGGKQYRVRQGDELLVERLAGEVGDRVELPVSLRAEDGTLDLEPRTARAEILEHLRGEKVRVYKYKPKKGYRRKKGHRQALTRIRVVEV
jgi:large subunit ribosomal protein L21